MRNMMRFGKDYGGRDPELIEGDIFRIVVKVSEFATTENDDGANRGSVDKARSKNIAIKEVRTFWDFLQYCCHLLFLL